MKRLVIDTDILIEVSKNNIAVAELLNHYQKMGYELCLSVVTKYEMVIGSLNKKDMQSLLKFISRFECLPLNPTISKIGDDLIINYALSHGLRIGDALIASTAIDYNADLISRNQKDFRYINGLNLLPCLLS